MKAADPLQTIRKFFLVFLFLAFTIDNPFSGAFGGYQAFTGIPANLLFATISALTGIPIPFSIYEWTIFGIAFLIFKKQKSLGEFPSGVVQALALYWGYVLFWAMISAYIIKTDTQAIFWDFKGLITAPFLMFIFARLFPQPQDWVIPFKVFAGAILFKCSQALFLNAFVWEAKHRVIKGYLIDHAASYQISTVLLVILGSMIFRSWRPQNLRTTFAVVTVILILLAAFVLNQRRTEMAGFAMSLILMGGIIGSRRPIATIVALPFLGIFVTLYVAAFANSTSILGKPIQMLNSLNDAKNLSNLYRKIENYNLFSSLSDNPFFGQGFGTPMHDVAGLSAFLDGNFFLLHPHNSILGLWMQAGIVGFCFFMLMFSIFSFYALRNIFRKSSPLALTMGAVALSNLFRYLVFSEGDQLFLHSSSNFVLGATLGAIVVVAQSTQNQTCSGSAAQKNNKFSGNKTFAVR